MINFLVQFNFSCKKLGCFSSPRTAWVIGQETNEIRPANICVSHTDNSHSHPSLLCQSYPSKKWLMLGKVFVLYASSNILYALGKVIRNCIENISPSQELLLAKEKCHPNVLQLNRSPVPPSTKRVLLLYQDHSWPLLMVLMRPNSGMWIARHHFFTENHHQRRLICYRRGRYGKDVRSIHAVESSIWTPAGQNMVNGGVVDPRQDRKCPGIFSSSRPLLSFVYLIGVVSRSRKIPAVVGSPTALHVGAALFYPTGLYPFI